MNNNANAMHGKLEVGRGYGNLALIYDGHVLVEAAATANVSKTG